jgi:hypothetical protein
MARTRMARFVDSHESHDPVEQDKLLWASRSETFNPTSPESLVKSVADATVKEMKKRKVL